MYPVIIHDPYRNCDTTYSAFAKAEGCPRMAVYLYNRRHGTLEGFRDRPKQGEGRRPHTYTRNGKYISVTEVLRLTGMAPKTLKKYAEQGIVDADELMKASRYKRGVAPKLIPSDSGEVFVPDYAKQMGVSVNSLYLYISRHGSLVGYTTRGASRLKPLLFPHNGLGVSKTIKEWAHFFNRSEGSIKSWLHLHGRTMDGYGTRKVVSRRHIMVALNGRPATLREWAQAQGEPYEKVKNYYYNHKTLEGYGEGKRGRAKSDAA